MNRRRVRQLKFISYLFILILFCELIYMGYRVLYHSEESVYFEGINALISNGDGYVSVGSNNDNDNHYEKAKISFYNSKREKEIEKLYNVGYNSSFFGIAKDKDGVVVVGSYEKTTEEHENSIRHALIVKYDFDGNILFEKDFSLLDNSKFTSIAIVGDSYYVTGQSIYRNTRVGDQDGGAILAKYNKDGELLWYQTYGSSKSSTFNDLYVTDQAIYAVGADDNYIGIIVQYDLDGNYIAYNDYKTTDSLGFSGITTANGFIYVSGALRRKQDDNDAIIVRYNMNCVYIDQVEYQGEGIERFHKLIVDDHDYLVAIGTMATPKKDNGVGEYNYDGIIAKYDLDLKYIDSVSYGDERDDFFTDIVAKEDEYIVVGYSFYGEGSYLSKFIRYSRAFKVLEVLS